MRVVYEKHLHLYFATIPNKNLLVLAEGVQSIFKAQSMFKVLNARFDWILCSFKRHSLKRLQSSKCLFVRLWVLIFSMSTLEAVSLVLLYLYFHVCLSFWLLSSAIVSWRLRELLEGLGLLDCQPLFWLLFLQLHSKIYLLLLFAQLAGNFWFIIINHSFTSYVWNARDGLILNEVYAY